MNLIFSCASAFSTQSPAVSLALELPGVAVQDVRANRSRSAQGAWPGSLRIPMQHVAPSVQKAGSLRPLQASARLAPLESSLRGVVRPRAKSARVGSLSREVAHPRAKSARVGSFPSRDWVNAPSACRERHPPTTQAFAQTAIKARLPWLGHPVAPIASLASTAPLRRLDRAEHARGGNFPSRKLAFVRVASQEISPCQGRLIARHVTWVSTRQPWPHRAPTAMPVSTAPLRGVGRAAIARRGSFPARKLVHARTVRRASFRISRSVQNAHSATPANTSATQP